MPYEGSSYPINFNTPRTTVCSSIYPLVVISPPTRTRPVVVNVSQATRESGSCERARSSTASDIWSHILSGCPSPTLSEVNTKSFLAINLLPPAIVLIQKNLCCQSTGSEIRFSRLFSAFFKVVAICRKSIH
ncbi:hypothetical protein ES708_27036 [subsurface metagenome]